MFHKTRPTTKRNMMRYWIRLETLRLRMIISFAAVMFCLYSIPHSSLRGRFSIAGSAARVAAVLLLVLLLFFLTGTKFAVKHSAIGRQLARFGDFNTVYREVCEAAQSPLYTNGTEVISEDYIFLMPEPANMPQSMLPSFNGRLLILAVSELESVSVTPDALYPDEMNTILFRTACPLKDAVSDNCQYAMTVHTDAAAAQELALSVTARIRAWRAATSNPYRQDARTSAASENAAAEQTASTASQNTASERAASTASENTATDRTASTASQNTAGRAFYTSSESTAAGRTFSAYEESFSGNSRPNSYPYRSARTPAARSAARFRSDPLRELKAGKMRVFRLIVSFIILVNVGAMLFLYFMTGSRTLSALPRDLAKFVRRELLDQPEQLLFLVGLLAFYLVPSILIYVLIRRWYRRFLEQFEKLPRQEQKELLSKLCDNFETGQPAVIYTEHCFCFRNMRMLSFQTLLPYSSVLWIYRSHGLFYLPSSSPDLGPSVEFCHLIVRTADRRKYRILSDEESALSRRAPEAVVGYGDEEKKIYREKVRELKWR